MKTLWCLWLVLALFFGGVALWWQRTHTPPRLVLPRPLTRVDILRAETTLRLTKRDGQWRIDGEAAPLFAPWLALFERGCFAEYRSDSLPQSAFAAAITLRLNGSDEWIFGSHNSYSHAHYLRHGKITYLCDERLKPRLALPAVYWKGSDARTSGS